MATITNATAAMKATKATDILAEALSLTEISQHHRTWRLSESEDDRAAETVCHQPTLRNMASEQPVTRKVEPIRLHVKQARKIKTTTSASKVKRCRKSCTEAPKTTNVLTDVQQVVAIAEDINLRRLNLDDALEHAGKLFDELRMDRFVKEGHESTFAVFRKLCIRKIMIETLACELHKRNVLPVTLNTLSNVFASVYMHIVKS